MAVNIPRDLEDEILSRVPDKSLARFRSVCKQWNSQLLEETFLEQHSSRMHNYGGEQHRLLIRNGLSRISSVGSVAEQQQEKMINPFLTIEDLSLLRRNVSNEFRKRIKVYKIAHCTGLLLYIMDNQLLIWNPSLKETRWVKCGSDFHWFDDAYGLGFIRQSPTHRDYKLVRFRCARNERDRPPRIEVYEFPSNTWKVITDTISFDWQLRVPLSSVSLGEVLTGFVLEKTLLKLSYRASIFPKKGFNSWITFLLGMMSIILLHLRPSGKSAFLVSAMPSNKEDIYMGQAFDHALDHTNGRGYTKFAAAMSTFPTSKYHPALVIS